jgi:hypothetical protein
LGRDEQKPAVATTRRVDRRRTTNL